jgi:hypothetical protein
MERSFAGLNRKPKSIKGWQEWRRKYASAFLSDQLNRAVPAASKRRYVVSLLMAWEKRFRAECGLEKPEQYVFPGDIVEDQIDFVTQYIACALVNGTGDERFKRIRHFLSMQSAQNLGQRFELRFQGGSPLEAYAYMDSLKDIDIADMFFIADFESMSATRPKMKKWTSRTAKSFIAGIKKDLLFDFPDAVILVDSNPTGQVTLEIGIEVDEYARNLKMIQCMPAAFRRRFRAERENLEIPGPDPVIDLDEGANADWIRAVRDKNKRKRPVKNVLKKKSPGKSI